MLSFGVNQDWDMGPQPREIQLHHRIILSPGAAKRLLDLMTKLIHDHEASTERSNSWTRRSRYSGLAKASMRVALVLQMQRVLPDPILQALSPVLGI